MDSNRFRFFAPPEILRKDVDGFLVSEFNGDEGKVISVFPNALPGIVFHHKAGQPAIENITLESGGTFSPPSLFLYGPGIEPSVMNFRPGSYTVIRVVLQPHALKSLFGLNALALKNCIVELNELASEKIDHQLMEAGDKQQQVALLINFLVEKRKAAKTRDPLVEESLCLIHKSAGVISVKALLEHLNISERQFERRFCQAVGISPLSYIRVRRFNEAMRLMKTGRYKTLTDIAYALNFHDQSHFIREIKSFTGTAPKGLLSQAGDFFHSQAGYSYL